MLEAAGPALVRSAPTASCRFSDGAAAGGEAPSREEGRPRSEATRQARAASAEASKRRVPARSQRAPRPPARRRRAPAPAPSSDAARRAARRQRVNDGGLPADSRPDACGGASAPLRAARAHLVAAVNPLNSRADVADSDPDQARRLRARAQRRGHLPLRGQGPAPRGDEAADRRRGDRQRALRRARREAIFRRARRVHHRRPAGGDGARGRRARSRRRAS